MWKAMKNENNEIKFICLSFVRDMDNANYKKKVLDTLERNSSSCGEETPNLSTFIYDRFYNPSHAWVSKTDQ